jgi:hypothetical protein
MSGKNLLLVVVLSMFCFSTGAIAQKTASTETIQDTLNQGVRPEISPHLDPEIQRTINEYFAWLHKAEKGGALNAETFKPVVSHRESQRFLNAKSEVLQLIEYSNQINNVRIERTSVTLSVRSFSLDKQRKFADVEIVERYERKYEYFAEPAMGEIVHRIKLRSQLGQWEIIDDQSNATDAPTTAENKYELMENIREESIRRRATEQYLLIEAGITNEFLAQERARLTKQGLAPKVVEEQLTLIVNERMSGSNKFSTDKLFSDSFGTMLNTNRNYNRTACVTYIDRWWNRRNSAWGNFNELGGDCTNWVSQIINAGGVPEDKSGSYQWYWDNMNAPRSSPPYSRSASWAGVDELWNYIQGNSNNNGANGPQGQWWTTSAGLSQMNSGDFIQLKRSNSWYHTYGVYDGKWVNLKPWYCPWCADNFQYKVRVTSHSADRHREDLDNVAASSPTRRYMRIKGWYQQ